MTELSERSSAAAPALHTTSVERRIVTVLFADLVGFTTLSEQFDAEEVATVQDAYFASVRATIERHAGTLEKFIGDAAMAVFGAPQTREDDAERAVRAGLALIAAVEQLGARLGLDPGQLRLRVGINSGEVVHATSGPDAGRITGDTVNTAARLQTAAAPDRVLVGELTALAVREAIELSEMGLITLKGKAEPVRAWQADAVRPEPSRDAALGGLRAPLLGRDDELEKLARFRGGRITILAPPGVGKSRLVAELEARTTAEPRPVLRGRVRPQAGTPYEVVRHLLVAAGAETGLRAAVGSITAGARREVIEREVGALLAPAVGERVVHDVAAEREAKFGAWTQALDALAPRATWIVEDVHWAGPDLLAFLAAAAEPERLIVCTARPSLLDSAAEWVAAGERLDLATLPPTDAAGLVRALVGDVLPEDLVAAVAERSDGNPLFIEELLRTWISVGTLVRDDHGWRLAVAPDAVTLPATVQAIYAAQLDDLPADARLVARHASVAGRRFADAALGPLEIADRRAGLETLRRRAFLAGPLHETSGKTYAYRHALLRDAGYASLARVERSRLHVALARWLEETAGDRTADVAQLIAEHYAAAVDAAPTVGVEGDGRAMLAHAASDWFERAATAALAVAAPGEAIRLLDRSIELTEATTAEAVARRRLRRGEILADSAELDAAIVDLAAALDAFHASLPESAALYAEAAYGLGLAYMQQIRFGECEALTAHALGELTGMDAPAGKARLMALHAWSVAAQGRDEGAADEARTARDLGAALGDATLNVDLLEHYAATTDELEVAEPGVWDELERSARAAGRWRQVVIALRVRGLLKSDENPVAALPLIQESAELADAHGLTEQRGWAELGRAEALFVHGDWDAALDAADSAITLGERYSYQRLVFRTWMVAWPILAELRDASWTPRFNAWWGSAFTDFPSTPSPYGVVLTAARQLWIARAGGERVVSADLVLPDRIPPFVNPHFVAAREIIAEALIERGEIDRAADVGGQEPDSDWTPLMRASQALVKAWVAVARGDSRSAAEQAGTAAREAEAIGARWWIARARAIA